MAMPLTKRVPLSVLKSSDAQTLQAGLCSREGEKEGRLSWSLPLRFFIFLLSDSHPSIFHCPTQTHQPWLQTSAAKEQLAFRDF